MYHIKIVFAGLEVFNYKVVSNLRDKIPTDLAVLYRRNTSPVQCVQRCALNKNCLSVFLTSDSICQGYSKVYGIDSSSLILQAGTKSYAWKITGIDCSSMTSENAIMSYKIICRMLNIQQN